MANRFSLEGTIEPTVDQRAAERQGRELADTFEGELGDLQVGAGGDFDSFARQNGGGAGGGGMAVAGGTGAAARGILSGGTATAAASAALPVALAGGTAFGILKATQKAAQASPAMQQTSKMWGQAMTLFFRPFGNFMSSVLRPYAASALQMAVKFNEIAGDNGLRVALGWADAQVKDQLGFTNIENSLEDLSGIDLDLGSVEWATLFASVGQKLPTGNIMNLLGISLPGEISAVDLLDHIEWGEIKENSIIGSISWPSIGAKSVLGPISWPVVDTMELIGEVGWPTISADALLNELTGGDDGDATLQDAEFAVQGSAAFADLSIGTITYTGEMLFPNVNWTDVFSPILDFFNDQGGSGSSGDEFDMADAQTLNDLTPGRDPNITDTEAANQFADAVQAGRTPDLGIDLARGGVVGRRTQATIGEAGPEAVMPLDRLSREIGQAIRTAMSTTGGGSDRDLSRLVDRIDDLIRENRRTRRAIESQELDVQLSDRELDPLS